MKSSIRKLLTKHYAISPEFVISAIDKADCKEVSFDVFDTLIKRNVPTPKDVFLLLEKQYQRHFGHRTPIYKLRSQAEVLAAKDMGRIEISLLEIYQTIKEIDDTERKWLIEEEIRIEQAVCQRWQPMGRVYDWCLSKGIPVILVSDMYLSRDIITELLHSAGYFRWKHLYISAEDHGNKTHGTLFDIVLREEHLKPEELIHIGDSLYGDYLTPRKMGIQAVLIEGNHQRRYCNNSALKSERRQGELSYQVIDSIVNNNIDQYGEYFQRLGYAIVGPILYGYCKWLSRKIKENNIDRIYFLAREGYLLKRCFDYFNEQQVPCNVIEVSRKATTLPRLYRAKNFDELLHMISVERENYTISKMMSICEIDEQLAKELTGQVNIQLDKKIDAIPENKKEELFKLIMPLINTLSREQEKCLRGYIDQLGSAKRIAVCDVGWHGTIQSSLQVIFPNLDMIGYYIGKISRNAKQNVYSEAYLFDENNNSDISRCVIGTLNLFELLFLSTEGSARYYVNDKNGKYRCERFPAEQTQISAQKIIALQDAAVSFICDMKRLDHELDIEVSPKSSAAAYCQFVENIDQQSIRELSKFSFLNVEKYSLIAEHSLVWYLLRPRSFFHDFLNNGSKVLFLKSLFRVPLPYVKIVDFLRSIDNKRKTDI